MLMCRYQLCPIWAIQVPRLREATWILLVVVEQAGSHRKTPSFEQFGLFEDAVLGYRSNLNDDA